jgi:hypothetical protein
VSALRKHTHKRFQRVAPEIFIDQLPIEQCHTASPVLEIAHIAAMKNSRCGADNFTGPLSRHDIQGEDLGINSGSMGSFQRQAIDL